MILSLHSQNHLGSASGRSISVTPPLLAMSVAHIFIREMLLLTIHVLMVKYSEYLHLSCVEWEMIAKNNIQ